MAELVKHLCGLLALKVETLLRGQEAIKQDVFNYYGPGLTHDMSPDHVTAALFDLGVTFEPESEGRAVINMLWHQHQAARHNTQTTINNNASNEKSIEQDIFQSDRAAEGSAVELASVTVSPSSAVEAEATHHAEWTKDEHTQRDSHSDATTNSSLNIESEHLSAPTLDSQHQSKPSSQSPESSSASSDLSAPVSAGTPGERKHLSMANQVKALQHLSQVKPNTESDIHTRTNSEAEQQREEVGKARIDLEALLVMCAFFHVDLLQLQALRRRFSSILNYFLSSL